ncbi:hypothetical protein IM699_27105 [Rhodococcus qingshengii]|nr:hypothetical protein IM699_27105 [Rhodococcus qingshengii]
MTTPDVGADRPRRWEYPALVALGVAVVLVLGLTIFLTNRSDSDENAAAEQDAERSAQVQSFLDAWAAAQMSDDPSGLAKFVDSSAAPGVLEAEVRRATAAGALEFSDWGYEIPSGGLTPAPRTGAPGGDVEVWNAQVLLRYALDGVDALPTRKAVSMTLAKRGDQWSVLADGSIVGLDGARTAGESWNGPWDFGPLAVAENSAGNALVIGHPGQQAFVDALAADVDSAIENTTQLWGPWWSERAVLMVAGSAEEFTALVGSHHDGASIAAVSVADATADGSSDVSGQRVVFSPAAASRLTDITRRTVLRHELMHIAARSKTRDGSPMWVLEGFAEYAGNRGSSRAWGEIAPTLAAAVRSGDTPAEFPDDTQFSGVPVVSSLAYESAWSINAYIADRFGEAKLTDLFRALASGKMTAEDLDSRIRAVVGVGTEELRAGWVDWTNSHLG